MSPEALVEQLTGAITARWPGGRMLVALAGPPGAGKSMLAEATARRLGPARCAVLPMDGFHYDDLYLIPLGLRARKGAPETFDALGLRATIRRLREAREPVAVPVFDRALEIARAGARVIAPDVPVVLVEGNWLLLDHGPFAGLAGAFDLTVRLAVPEPELRRRLEARWRGLGLGPGEVAAKVDGNDLPNARLVAAASRPADLVLEG